MNELLKALIAEWGIVQAVAMINQIVTPTEYFGDNFFSDREGKYADNLVIPIKRGDTVIMEAIPSGAPRPESSDGSLHKLPVTLARFADKKIISVKDLKHLMSFTDLEKQADAFATIIGKKAGEMKNKFTATKEYMRLGAILGEVRDGSGALLFKFKDDDVNPLALGLAVDPAGIFEEYEDDLITEFGHSPEYMMFADRALFNNIYKYAQTAKLTGKDGIVHKVKIDGRTCIDYDGRIIRPVTNAYPDKHKNTVKFLQNNRGVLLPLGTDAFTEFYTHAENADAIDGAPAEYFSKVSDFGDGDGVKVIAESVCIPICVRPYAVREVQWS